jgi:hypothetical protein
LGEGISIGGKGGGVTGEMLGFGDAAGVFLPLFLLSRTLVITVEMIGNLSEIGKKRRDLIRLRAKK